MSDDQREREPLRDQGDNPPEHGTRSDIGASGDADRPVAPGGEAIRRTEQVAGPPRGDRDSPSAPGVGDGGTPTDPLADVDHPTADE